MLMDPPDLSPKRIMSGKGEALLLDIKFMKFTTLVSKKGHWWISYKRQW